MPALYLDSSALLKLVFAEAETAALQDFLTANAASLVVTSQLARTEVLRACRRIDGGALPGARALLDSLDVIALVPSITDAAAELDPPTLRSLDAIHLASALTLVEPTLVAYDQRLLIAAREQGLAVASPGAAD